MRELLLSTLVVASSCTNPSQRPIPQAVQKQANLVVATYNVNFGMAGDPATLAAIGSTGADVVVLQETSPGWERLVRAALSARYPHMIFRHDARWPAGGMAFLARYPLDSLDSSPSRVGWFFALRAIVKTPAGPVQLINLHLKPPVSDSGSVVSGVFSTPPQREREMKHHLHLVREGLPTLLLGDFNEKRGGGLAVLKKRGYRDVLSTRSTPTWRWKVGPITLRHQLDHVLYDPQRLKCLGTRVLRQGRSDHLPVVAWFRLLKS